MYENKTACWRYQNRQNQPRKYFGERNIFCRVHTEVVLSTENFREHEWIRQGYQFAEADALGSGRYKLSSYIFNTFILFVNTQPFDLSWPEYQVEDLI